MGEATNNHLYRILRYCLALLLFTPLLAGSVKASDARPAASPVHIHIFWSKSCPHCHEALEFLKRIETKDAGIHVYRYEISGDQKNLDLLLQTAKAYNRNDAAIPLILIGSKVITGYNNDSITGTDIKLAVFKCRHTACPDGMKLVKTGGRQTTQVEKDIAADSLRQPILGDISLSQLSLPILTIALGAADGFNPCALWVLVFLLSMLAGMKSRSRRWILGSVFVMASALVYYLIMAAWLNTLMLLGFVIWVRLAIGLVALCVGGWSIREYFVNPEAVCKVSSSPKRQAILEKLRTITLAPKLAISIVGIILLAFAVNIVELLCSAGIPATYTQLLAIKNLAPWQYHAYIGLYVLVFMLDDLLLFFGAMLAFEFTSLGTRYARYANLIGGMIMLALGALMIFKPEWLM